MSFHQIATARRESLINEWLRTGSVLVQAESTSVLGTLVFIDEHVENPSTAPSAQRVGRRLDRNVVCVQRDGLAASSASLWVAARYEGYREAYLAFIKVAHQEALKMTDLAGYDADHLLNRARSPKDTTFIRLEAVPADVNQAWGSFFEAAASDPSFVANRQRERRTMSFMVASKAAWQMPPEGPTDTYGINALVKYWANRGFPAEQARSAIDYELKHVFKLPKGGVLLPTTRWI
jgi:hypothetical protein